MPAYKPKETNVIQEILQDHFKSFEENYDTQYSERYGKYRIIRIKEAVEKFLECGNYSKGIARIKCTNPDCDHKYFRPWPLARRGHSKAGIYAQAATRKGSYYYQNTYLKMCFLHYLTGSLYFLIIP